MIHLQHHIRKIVLADHHRCTPGQVARERTQVHGLVRLHDAPGGAFRIPNEQVHRAQASDGRAAHRGDAFGEPSQPMRRTLVGGRGRLGHPGRRRLGVPELQAALVGVEIGTAQGDGRAAWKLKPGDGRGHPRCRGAGYWPQAALGLGADRSRPVRRLLALSSQVSHARMLTRPRQGVAELPSRKIDRAAESTNQFAEGLTPPQDRSISPPRDRPRRGTDQPVCRGIDPAVRPINQSAAKQ